MEKIILTEKNFKKLKEKVKKNKDKKIIFSSSDDDLNRKVMEKLDIQIILIPLENRKDYMKQRNSGFNQVMAKIAKKKNISLGVDFNEIINAKNKERVLARLKQNIFLCNKNKIQIKFFNCPETHDCKNLGLVLGMPTWMVKDLN